MFSSYYHHVQHLSWCWMYVQNSLKYLGIYYNGLPATWLTYPFSIGQKSHLNLPRSAFACNGMCTPGIYTRVNWLCRHRFLSPRLGSPTKFRSNSDGEMSHFVGVVTLKRIYPLFYRCFFNRGWIVVFSSVTTAFDAFVTWKIKRKASDKTHRLACGQR